MLTKFQSPENWAGEYNRIGFLRCRRIFMIRSYFRIALSAVGLITTCFATMNQSPANGAEQVWKEYVYKATGFAVTAPEAPKEQDLDYYRVFEFGLDSGVSLRLEVSKGKQDCPGFERWATQHGSSRQHMLLTVAGHTALDQWGQRPNTRTRFFTRGVCINSTTYLFAGDWPTDAPGPEIDEPRPEILTRILDSFRVVEKQSPDGSSNL
jgi:hypothetical protein